jgi:hypothetical protein
MVSGFISNLFMTTKQPTGQPLPKPPPDPHNVLREFFDRYDLRECQAELWKLLTAAFSSEDADYWDRRDRGNAAFFCKNLDEVLKALYELRDTIAGNKKTKDP